MTQPHISWEPENATPLIEIRACLEPLVQNRGGVTIMENGTLLFIKKADDDLQSARFALEEARFLVDFRVKHLPDGNALVALHSAVAVFVGGDEFRVRRDEIVSRIDELKFPSEELLVPQGWSQDEFLTGLYGRAKLQRDIKNANLYARLD